LEGWASRDIGYLKTALFANPLLISCVKLRIVNFTL
jgi:hypothetical protein